MARSSTTLLDNLHNAVAWWPVAAGLLGLALFTLLYGQGQDTLARIDDISAQVTRIQAQLDQVTATMGARREADEAAKRQKVVRIAERALAEAGAEKYGAKKKTGAAEGVGRKGATAPRPPKRGAEARGGKGRKAKGRRARRN